MAALALPQLCGGGHVAPPTTMAQTSGANRPPRQFRNVLILRKSTRWQWEKQNLSMNDGELKKYYQSKGIDYQEMLENEKKQVNAVNEIRTMLERAGIQARVVNKDQLEQMKSETDLIISAGGDGTFLTAASVVTDDTPVIGINTDPVGSEGHLCVDGKNPPRDLIDKLISGKLTWARRSRIRVTVKDPQHSKMSIFSLNKKARKSTTNLALNEVFIGEDEAAKVSTYNISIDDSSMVKQKSSGLIVSTGTGSTSWYLGMNRIDESTVTSLMEAMQSMGLNVPVNRNIVTRVAKTFNDKIPFEPDHPSFAFYIREPIFNATFKRTATRGFARRIRLESRCSNGFLVLDGSTKIPFPRGAIATIEMNSNDSLRTMISS